MGEAQPSSEETARVTALERLREMVDARAKVDQDLVDAIRVAHSTGLSLREIAAPTGLSHETVRKIIRDSWVVDG